MSDEETKIINAPERIWLQVGDDFEPGEVDFSGLEGVTWCQDNISDTDIEYVRSDRVASAVVPDSLVRRFVAALLTNDTDGSAQIVKAMVDYAIPAAPTGDKS
jgi:hypothetical protein